MNRLFVLTAVAWLAALEPAHAQTGDPLNPVPGGPPPPTGQPGASPSRPNGQTNPALSLQGMPCSVSLNSTGGVTTSPSCTTDPLSVPTRTIVSPAQVNGSASAQDNSSPQTSSGP